MKTLHSIPVAGGELTVAEWGPADGAPVVAIHGISGTHMSWNTVARLAGEQGKDLRILAPDLRGRGRSTELPGPYGMAAHARDIAQMLDALRIPEATIMGHSMGAFVTVAFSHLFPQKISSGLLIDGGLPIPPPPGATAEELTAAILNPIEARLAAPVASLETYLDAWRAHPAFDTLTDDLREYITYDLLERSGQLWAAGNFEAIKHDGVTLATDETLLQALTARGITEATAEGFAPPAPLEFLRAEKGLVPTAPPLYTAEQALELGSYFSVPVTTVSEVNHFTIVMGENGAREILTHLG